MVTTYLSLQLWESLASGFPKVGELAVGEPVSLLYTQAVCAAGTNSEGTPERSISVLSSPWRYCPHEAGGYVSRLIYLFYFGLGGKNYANWGRHVLCFPAEPAASPVASMLWQSTMGRGRLQVLNFVMLLCCQVKKKKKNDFTLFSIYFQMWRKASLQFPVKLLCHRFWILPFILFFLICLKKITRGYSRV